LKRGTELPFKVVKEYFTVTDYQTKTILNIYRGERPFVRYCEKVGVLVVQNLPKRKAGEVNIKVSFAVDENETLQIEAQHLSRDENGKIIESELYEMHIDRAAESKVMETEGELILESQKFKNDDANTLESVDRINNLIDSIRLTSTKLPNQKEIEDLINQHC
jgi:molecular chaperone DnaK (HSP70)